MLAGNCRINTGTLAYFAGHAAFMGGHWTAGVRVSVPFSIRNLVTGRNPFEGVGEMFRPRKREFKQRMSEMIIRSHRIQTGSSSSTQMADRTTRETSTVQLGAGTLLRTQEPPRQSGFPIE